MGIAEHGGMLKNCKNASHCSTKEVLALVAKNRTEESHFAGGIVLNVADNSARYSHDFDIFHELAEEVTRASNKDVQSLRTADFK
jgi:hypothetical protein